MTTGKEEFLQTLTEQIRCVKARPGIVRELEDHIEDQAAVLEEYGMERESAVKEAVRRMGDPVEIGMQLDLIHRPQTNRRMILVIVLCTIGGLAVQYATGMFTENSGAFGRQILFCILGFFVMTGVYFLDYGWIGSWAKEVYLLMTVTTVLGILFLAPQINGMHRAGIIPMYLFVPVYAGILYQYRGEGIRGILKAALWIFPPVMIAWYCIPSLSTAANLFLICGVMVLAAVARGWFVVDRKKMILLLVFIGVILPVLLLAFGYFFWFADYQKARLTVFLNPASDPYGAGYVTDQIRQLLMNSGLSLFTGIAGENSESLINFVSVDKGYGLIHLILSYGVFFGIAVVTALIKLILMAFGISLRQKNQLGYMIGFGCGMIFLVMCLEGIAMNLTLFPSTTIVFPFLSTGGGAVLVYSVLLGLLLSVHRYQNVLGEVRKEKQWKKKYRTKIRLELEQD